MRYQLPFLILALSVLLFPTTCLSQHVYKWTDQNGVVHFSDRKPFAGAKPAELPEITRGEFQLTKKLGKTCLKHGGIDCQAGADKDGSVICVDGFKGASARFKFACSSPRLEISDISEVDQSGVFQVFIRNSRSVAAKQPEVLFHLASGNQVALNGPKNIEPFGMAEFSFEPIEGLSPGKVTPSQLTVSCANCG